MHSRGWIIVLCFINVFIFGIYRMLDYVAFTLNLNSIFIFKKYTKNKHVKFHASINVREGYVTHG